MASRKRQSQNMEPASLWNERNDAHLLSIIEEKLISIKREIRDCRRPAERNRLKAKRAEYRDIYTKVKKGDYCGNIILNQFLDSQEACKLAQMRQEEIRVKLEKELEKGNKEKKPSKEEKRREKFQKKQAKIEKQDAKYEKKYEKKGKKVADEEAAPKEKSAKVARYVDAFSEVNFDYQGYFRKTRYYGVLLPFVSLILIIAILGVFLSGVFIPAKQLESIQYTTGLQMGNILTFKLGPDALDYLVPNDGNWPTGTWMATREKPQLAIGKLYEKESYEEGYVTMVTPDEVFLYQDLGMTSITVTTLDVLKAFFYTPLMTETRIDPIEDFPLIRDKTCWYYIKFMRDRDRLEAITIQRQADGTYDASTIVRWLATYGTIFCLMGALLFLLICLVQIIIRFFTYTSRKLHVTTFLALVFSTLAVMLPALLMVEGISFADLPETFEVLKGAYTSYLVLDSRMFMQSIGTISIGLFPLISLGLMLGLLVLPLFFKNRLRLKPSYVPKGNRPHTFLIKDTPTQIGEMGPPPKKRASQPGAAMPIQLNPALLGGLMPAGAPAPVASADVQSQPATAQGGKRLSKKDIKKVQAKMAKGK